MALLVGIVSLTAGAQESKDAVPAKKLTQSEVQQMLVPLWEELATPIQQQDTASMKRICLVWAIEHPDASGVLVVGKLLPQLMETSELIAFIKGNDYYSNDETIKRTMKTWESVGATSEGKMFVDFSATYEGKTTRLSDYVGKGKYVLVDFWASWCGPCKAEIPNLIKVYNTYKGDRFTVLGVATWDEPQNTLKAIDQLAIPYPQMLNAQYAGSDAYGIEGIPQIILFGPDGTIIKRDLRGEAIEKAVADCLK